MINYVCHGMLMISEDNLWEILLSFHMWIPGITLRSSGSQASTFPMEPSDRPAESPARGQEDGVVHGFNSISSWQGIWLLSMPVTDMRKFDLFFLFITVGAWGDSDSQAWIFVHQ